MPMLTSTSMLALHTRTEVSADAILAYDARLCGIQWHKATARNIAHAKAGQEGCCQHRCLGLCMQQPSQHKLFLEPHAPVPLTCHS